jgi:putative oxidoreductase
MSKDNILRALHDSESRGRQRYEKLRATAQSLPARDVALLVARICLAWIFIHSGAGTLFGAFGGAGLHREAIFYSTVAHLHPGTFFAVLGGSIECFGGAAVGLGIFGRLAAAGLVGDMIMAMITVTWVQGLTGNATVIGYQLNLALIGAALVIAVMGTGRVSLDYGIRSLLTRSRTEDSARNVATASS